MEFRREYECVSLDRETLDVACVYKEYNYIDKDNSAQSYYDHISSELVTSLDDQIRAIRLLLEGPVRYKKLAVKMNSDLISHENDSWVFIVK